MARKLTDTEIAEMKVLLDRNFLTAGRTIDPGSAAATIDKWLSSAELQPPVVPKLDSAKPADDRSGPKI